MCVEFCNFSENFLWNFVRISRQIPEKSDVCRFFTQICENKLENCRKFWNLNFVKFIQYYSILFNRVLSGHCPPSTRRRRRRPSNSWSQPVTIGSCRMNGKSPRSTFESCMTRSVRLRKTKPSERLRMFFPPLSDRKSDDDQNAEMTTKGNWVARAVRFASREV